MLEKMEHWSRPSLLHCFSQREALCALSLSSLERTESMKRQKENLSSRCQIFFNMLWNTCFQWFHDICPTHWANSHNSELQKSKSFRWIYELRCINVFPILKRKFSRMSSAGFNVKRIRAGIIAIWYVIFDVPDVRKCVEHGSVVNSTEVKPLLLSLGQWGSLTTPFEFLHMLLMKHSLASFPHSAKRVHKYPWIKRNGSFETNLVKTVI